MRGRSRPLLCPKCWYPVGDPDEACPECGVVYRAARRRRLLDNCALITIVSVLTMVVLFTIESLLMFRLMGGVVTTPLQFLPLFWVVRVPGALLVYLVLMGLGHRRRFQAIVNGVIVSMLVLMISSYWVLYPLLVPVIGPLALFVPPLVLPWVGLFVGLILIELGSGGVIPRFKG